MRPGARQQGGADDPDARTLERWVRMVKAAPAIRRDKVARVRAAIQADRYDDAAYVDAVIRRLGQDLSPA